MYFLFSWLSIITFGVIALAMSTTGKVSGRRDTYGTHIVAALSVFVVIGHVFAFYSNHYPLPFLVATLCVAVWLGVVWKYKQLEDVVLKVALCCVTVLNSMVLYTTMV